MFKLDPDKNPVICLFLGAFAFFALYALWPYILAAVVLYDIVQGFTRQPDHSNHTNRRRRCPRCRCWSRW